MSSITYNGVTTNVAAGKTATLLCKGKKMTGNLVFRVDKIPTGGGSGNTSIISNGSTLFIENAVVTEDGENTLIIGG